MVAGEASGCKVGDGVVVGSGSGLEATEGDGIGTSGGVLTGEAAGVAGGSGVASGAGAIGAGVAVAIGVGVAVGVGVGGSRRPRCGRDPIADMKSLAVPEAVSEPSHTRTLSIMPSSSSSHPLPGMSYCEVFFTQAKPPSIVVVPASGAPASATPPRRLPPPLLLLPLELLPPLLLPPLPEPEPDDAVPPPLLPVGVWSNPVSPFDEEQPTNDPSKSTRPA